MANWLPWRTPHDKRRHHHLNAFHCSHVTDEKDWLNPRRPFRTIGKARPIVQHGNVDDSVYVFPPAFQRISQPPGIQTRQMSTICAGVTTSGDVVLTFARCCAVFLAHKALQLPLLMSQCNTILRKENQVDASYSVSPDIRECAVTVFGSNNHRWLDPACGYAYPSTKLMHVLRIHLLQRADKIGWGMACLAGHRDRCLPGYSERDTRIQRTSICPDFKQQIDALEATQSFPGTVLLIALLSWMVNHSGPKSCSE